METRGGSKTSRSEGTIIHVRQNNANEQLYEASISGCVATLKSLLHRDPLLLYRLSLTSFGETPLHIAAMLGHLDLVSTLVRSKRQLASELDSLGRSPLHLASAEGHIEIVKVLSEANSEVCMVADEDDMIPLHLAAMRGRVEIIRELIRVQPQSAHETLHGDSVLHLTIRYGHLEALQAFVELVHNSSSELLTRKDSGDNTVLHLAVMLNQAKTVRYLVSLGKTNVKAMNKKGFTALDVVEHSPLRDFKTLQIRQILMEADATRGNNNALQAHNDETDEPEAAAARALAYLRYPLELLERLSADHGTKLEEIRGSMMVVVTVIATMVYQSGVNPPGGVWPENSYSAKAGKFTCTAEKACLAGTAVLAYANTDSYFSFAESNLVSFWICLVVIAVLVSGLPLRNRIVLSMLTVLVVALVRNIGDTLQMAVQMITPHFDPPLRRNLISSATVATFAFFPFLAFPMFVTVREIEKAVKRLVRRRAT